MALVKSLGICIGSTSISFVTIIRDADKTDVLSAKTIAYRGNPQHVLEGNLQDINLTDLSVIVTGRKYRQLVNTVSVSEPEAIEETVRFLKLNGRYRVIASLGGENFMVYCLNEAGDINQVLTGNKCASGTGEFFLQQIGRMNLSIEEALVLARSKNPHLVSGRCSVFCKSDCTHALNKGIDKGEVVAGLCKMVTNKIVELLAKQSHDSIAVIGGVSQNDSVIHFMREKYPHIFIPKEAVYFEALGAALIGLKRNCRLDKNKLFRTKQVNFSFLEPLDDRTDKVKFMTLKKDQAQAGDTCIIGLDVGSTTTKAVIIRVDDDALLASVYLRTNGNPIQASVECYRELRKQITEPINIIGLGTTGSGRHIAGLHALTEGVVNEIIAHAVAAAFYNKDVDTIFEIGGQDAKYTHLTNGVASDYAMNEACSAGTGSFLEEAAKESLDIDYRDIGEIALKSKLPPNFNDQCSAFISSDIKNAIHEGISKVDIVAGLVYSICMNYINRVKGNRPVGKVVFMQGGVCYNRAVPIAMSKLTGKQIIVPPEPGLIGAFGVALEIKKRIQLGLMKLCRFDLDNLINREFRHSKDFICAGGREKCDLKCKIAILEIEGKKYPFGGACSKYYNQLRKIKNDPIKLDYVKKRQELVFNVSYPEVKDSNAKTIGISKSFLTNTLFPLYVNFFSHLGFKVILSNKVEKSGLDKIRSSFCYPVEISHGLFQNLLDREPDYIFLPHITEMNNPNEKGYKKLCPFVQGETYYIRSAFSGAKLPTLISPVINFAEPREKIRDVFIRIAKQLGKSAREGRKAFDLADKKQSEVYEDFKRLGQQALAELEADRDKSGMILFGRSYNAFADEANLGIPHKFASKGVIIIPNDLLPSDNLPSYERMYWYSGQQILRGARFVESHKQLFGVFITNFSCGPDSFILSYFRRIMGTKPSLTLELDSHSADVGINTRIDAAIDIIKNYIELSGHGAEKEESDISIPLSDIRSKGKFPVADSKLKKYSLTSPDVELLIPSMGRFSAEALAASFRSHNINARALPVPMMKTLKYGLSNANCKECLPYILTAGSLIEYVMENRSNEHKILFFMPTSSGPCRLGQYATRLNDLVEELRLSDVGIFSLSDADSYGGLGNAFFFRGWISVTIADLMQDIESSIMTLAVDPVGGSEVLDNEWTKVLEKIERGSTKEIFQQLEVMAEVLSQIELKYPLEEAKVISLTGEIYVRREEFSRMDLIKTLTKNGFVVRTTPIGEFIYYTNYIVKNTPHHEMLSFKDRLSIHLKDRYQKILEKKIKTILSKSKLIRPFMIEVEKTIAHSGHLISRHLLGEAILTTGLALREILDEACGVISIGPFACMPSRLAEAILNREMTLEGKLKSNHNSRSEYPEGITSLPYLHLETDGNAFPQIIQSKIEIFMLQADKMHKKMNGHVLPANHLLQMEQADAIINTEN